MERGSKSLTIRAMEIKTTLQKTHRLRKQTYGYQIGDWGVGEG